MALEGRPCRNYQEGEGSSAESNFRDSPQPQSFHRTWRKRLCDFYFLLMRLFVRPYLMPGPPARGRSPIVARTAASTTTPQKTAIGGGAEDRPNTPPEGNQQERKRRSRRNAKVPESRPCKPLPSGNFMPLCHQRNAPCLHAFDAFVYATSRPRRVPRRVRRAKTTNQIAPPRLRQVCTRTPLLRHVRTGNGHKHGCKSDRILPI